MKSVYLFLLGGMKIEIIENIDLKISYPDTDRDIVYVPDIYKYLFETFNITDATKACISVAKKHINDLIDKS